MPDISHIRYAALIALLFVSSWPANTPAQEVTPLRETTELLNYAYAAVLGNGYYRVGGESVYVIHLPFSKTQWKPGERGKAYGLTWLLPVNFGLYNFSFDELIPEDSDDVGTFSFMPGIELLIPLESGWALRPFAQYGFARDISNSETAQVYYGGLKARYDIVPLRSDTIGVTWGTRVAFAGYNPDTGSNGSLGQLSVGIDFRWPQKWQLISRQAYLGLFVYGNYYFDDAEFENIIDDPDTISREVTIGLSIGGMQDFELMGVEFERVGIGYRFGPNIRAITLFTEFPF